ncbi:hypothetical protein K2P97_09050 [bacterium]|nr:hypothetical protein [bacterium]
MASHIEIIDLVIRPSLQKACSTIPNVNAKGDISAIIFYGQEGAILDSLNLVNFIFLLESQLSEVLKVNVKFETEDILNTELKPFLNVANLTLFLEKKMKEAK